MQFFPAALQNLADQFMLAVDGSRDHAAAGHRGEGFGLLLRLHPEHFLLHLLRLLHHSRLIHSAGHTPESAFCHNMILLS